MASKRLYTVICLIFILVSWDKPIYADDPILKTTEKIKINDGPYIFIENENLLVKWIKNNKLKERKINNKNTRFLKRKFNIELHPEIINGELNYTQDYKNVDKIVAISDIHGQYDLALQLLKVHKVIDENNNWIFGKGHLVILGDIFDRGDKVTEMLWLVYKLEQQAEIFGGKVHYLIGNHELMIFHNDLRYIHKNYSEASSILGCNYSSLFEGNSILGSWLRSKPALVRINNILFTHAGISPELLKYQLSKSEINSLFINEIYNNDMMRILKDSTLEFLNGTNGPIWYRGYYSSNFSEDKLDDVLTYFKVNHVIVGHTSLPNIASFYNEKLIGIDSSIKLGDYGELLLIDDNTFYRGTLHGALLKLF